MVCPMVCAAVKEFIGGSNSEPGRRKIACAQTRKHLKHTLMLLYLCIQVPAGSVWSSSLHAEQAATRKLGPFERTLLVRLRLLRKGGYCVPAWFAHIVHLPCPYMLQALTALSCLCGICRKCLKRRTRTRTVLWRQRRWFSCSPIHPSRSVWFGARGWRLAYISC